jgi:membrane protein
MLTIQAARSEDERAGAPPAAQPPVRPSPQAGRWAQIKALFRYLAQTEVHTYAFSVAANAILSLFPFIVLMYTLAHKVFHSSAMEDVIGDMLRYFLPNNQDFVVKNMTFLAHAHSGVQIASIVTLLISSTGVFMPLEVALNQVWGVTKNRSYLMNQLVSLSLAFGVGALSMASIAVTTVQNKVLTVLFFGRTDNVVFAFFAHWVLQIWAVALSVTLFFLVYWILPNRKLPIRAVLPSAIVTGLLWELAKLLYVAMLPWLDFRSVYGPFSVSVSLMVWAFLTGLLLLAGAHYSASRYTLRLAHLADVESTPATVSV